MSSCREWYRDLWDPFSFGDVRGLQGGDGIELDLTYGKICAGGSWGVRGGTFGQ